MLIAGLWQNANSGLLHERYKPIHHPDLHKLILVISKSRLVHYARNSQETGQTCIELLAVRQMTHY